jgi:hypothetical protein
MTSLMTEKEQNMHDAKPGSQHEYDRLSISIIFLQIICLDRRLAQGCIVIYNPNPASIGNWTNIFIMSIEL